MVPNRLCRYEPRDGHPFEGRARHLLVPLLLLIALIPLSPNASASEPIVPIPSSLEHDPAKAALGQQLFHDPRLSLDDTVSCATCHVLDKGGVDGLPKSVGVGGAQGLRNAPTVYNATFNFRQFWDGRSANLAEQAGGPITAPAEMGMPSMDALVRKLAAIPDYQTGFKTAYGGDVTDAHVVDALSEYQKTLITPNAPFDKYLKGDEGAISDQAKQGYAFFKAYGCVACHQGVNVGGNMFQKFGVLKDINLQAALGDDLGRYVVTGNEWDKQVFKVPSLRLVALTPPYFHDGSVATLAEAVDIMIEFQLGRSVPTEHRDAIIAFLMTLPGEMSKGGAQ